MKILVLHPQIQVGHSLLLSLQKKGVGILLPSNTKEAWQMLQLHGASVSLAVIHRESATGQGEEGITLVAKARQDKVQKDLPVIITTQKWDDGQCAAHQETPGGANAYLKSAFSDLELLELIDGVMGTSLAAQTNPGLRVPVESVVESVAEAVIEDVQNVFQDVNSSSPPTLSFDLPLDFAMDEPEGGATRVLSPEELADVGLSPPPQTEELTSLGEFNLDDPGPSAIPTMQFTTPPSTPPSALPEELPQYSQELSQDSDASDVDESLISSQMPYLNSRPSSRMNPALPVGDAVVPGGAAHSPDLDTLKKYLMLREQDVAALSGQLKSAKDQVQSLEAQLQMERALNVELSHLAEEQKRKIDGFEREKQIALESSQTELAEIRFQVKQRADKARLLETQIRDATEETEKLKERVRVDIRKIRVREKDLENRLEIMKKDSEALLGARENKIIELKRKLDLLEFNMDLLQDQYSREKQVSATLRDRLSKAAQVVRVAGGLLNTPGGQATLDGLEQESSSNSSSDDTSGNVTPDVA